MAMPGVLPENSVCERVVSLIDLSQTMIEALGGTVLPHADGRSFWPLLSGNGTEWDDIAFSEYCTDAVPAWTGGKAVQQRMVRHGPWKLHVYNGYPPLLFNIQDDPHEQHDLAGDPRHADTLSRLLAMIQRDWDPDDIARQMQIRRERKDVLAAWANRVRPSSTYHWPLEAGMNRLEDVAGGNA